MNGADTAFVLISAALVMLMTPGLAFFYGGMVRVKSALNMLMMSFVSLGIVTVLWVLYGYSLAFGDDIGAGLLGGFDHVGLKGISPETLTGGKEGIPVFAFALFQLMFAVITPALMSGALADRVKFSAWAVFITLWVSIVYFPVAHWVWQADGWLFKLKVIDFAGGTAVHINAGVGALAAVLVVGKRIGFKKDPMRPHSLPLVMLGAGLLWFGWFGFNAGSALAANGTAANMALNTQVATGAAMLGWLAYERVRHGAFTTLGAASGAVAGLVAITPAGAAVNAFGAVLIGLVAGSVCAWAVGIKFKLGFDDSLDVVGVHLVGGVIGTLLVGLLATGGVGGLTQLGRQAAGAFAVMAYSFVASWLLAKLVDKTIGLRADEDDELGGIDQAFHAETAYDFSAVGGVSATRGGGHPAGPGRTDRDGDRDDQGGTQDKKANKKVDA
ncbi:ammonium transporter [Streptomyces albireticuli]|uniref:ammonium transporter n=1 Tax=Streptomyces albireticuli TaxID=1940 RepID=UPI001E572C3C|nr:ammonium transporter [Streptomyces albireticuli]MCD9144088.1 ammonium transporter [Streptomyces albireticuli]MCD9162269.1 ammonium transporter [Streptomyces albireticuli]MCD9195562.1 ammonium transporter [Streptomyces albireticuli]